MKEMILSGLLFAAGAAVVVPTSQPEAVAMPEQVAWADVRIPANVECSDGLCSIVRRRTVTVERVAPVAMVRASSGCQCEVCACDGCRFNGPVARSARATASVARTVGWRLTHPFGGRFRR